MKKSKILVLVAALALFAAACNKSSNPTTSGGDTSNLQTQSGTVTISMTSSGFSPSIVKVTSGTTVVFQNNDSKGRWPASNPHPTHTDLPGFDSLKEVAPGSSYSFVFNKVGTWGFHDHLFPTLGGSVVVVNQ